MLPKQNDRSEREKKKYPYSTIRRRGAAVAAASMTWLHRKGKRCLFENYSSSVLVNTAGLSIRVPPASDGREDTAGTVTQS